MACARPPAGGLRSAPQARPPAGLRAGPCRRRALQATREARRTLRAWLAAHGGRPPCRHGVQVPGPPRLLRSTPGAGASRHCDRTCCHCTAPRRRRCPAAAAARTGVPGAACSASFAPSPCSVLWPVACRDPGTGQAPPPRRCASCRLPPALRAPLQPETPPHVCPCLRKCATVPAPRTCSSINSACAPCWVAPCRPSRPIRVPLRCRHTRRPQSPSGLPPPHLSLSASARL